MVHNIHGQHQKLRKQHIHNSFGKKVVDRAVFAAGILGPIMTIPQLLLVYIKKNASSVSITTWTGYLLAAIIWFIYGVVHKEKPIILTYAIWILVDIAIVIGVILYD